VLAKARLTPLNNNTHRTIPRIELNAAKLSVLLKQILETELDYRIDEEIFWTDSTTVLHYINNENKQFTRFVANRIRFIRASTEPSQWRYVPSADNPADHASRGVSVAKFLQLNTWNNGPHFLRHSAEFWPHRTVTTAPPVELETKAKCLATTVVVATPCDNLMNSISCWFNLKRRIAWFLRYIAVLKGDNYATGRLTLSELKSAEIAILRYTQNKSFSTEIALVKSDKRLPRKNKLQKLDPFIDDNNLLRVGGRLQRSTLPYNTRHPIILPNNEPNVVKLMRHEHKLLGHMGRASIVASLRRSYWILGINTAVKRLQYECVVCRRTNANSHTQKMSQLPADRVSTDEPAFAHTGVDFFGPFETVNGRKREKTVRCGVHVSIIPSDSP